MIAPRVFFRVHAVQRMFERSVPVRDILQALKFGETIEDYSGEMPEPSRLILGPRGKRPFHVVASERPNRDEVTVITVYRPDPMKWDRDFKRRRP